MFRQRLLLSLSLVWLCNALFAQISFTNSNSLLSPSNHYSGVAIAIIDVNGDGLDDIVRLNQGVSLNIQYQTSANQAFNVLNVGVIPQNQGSQWGMCTGDMDNNGFADVLVGGRYDGLKVVSASSDGSAYTYASYNTPSIFTQGVNFADINNDGFLDAFACHDDGSAKIFANNGDGTFTYQPMWIDLTSYPSSDNSGNYGSVWSDVDNDGDVDLYIAHCRQGVNNPNDARRINQLFLNNGDGTYSQDTANVAGLRIGAQSWTADFGDIDNDGDFDCFITNHDVSSQLLENDGFGHFTDITVSSGLYNAIGGSPIQGVFRDFDNDGYVDILVAGSFQYLFKNNGDKTFSKVPNLFSNNNMESFAIGDLNGDGFQDIYAGYAEIYTTPSGIPDVLWMNDGNDNHFFGLNLRGQQSNRGGVGAKVQMFSALGIQTREVRSGESYGISNSLLIHFGLGAETHIDSVVVNWPSGIRDVILEPEIDQYLNFGEGGCLVPNISLEALGNIIFCAGDSLHIQAPAGYAYEWNTGDTTEVINVMMAGDYQVIVTDNDGCTAVSNTISVTVDPIEIPSITALGDTIFCMGGQVELMSSPSNSYLWSTGDTTQSISVSDGGAYTVITQGLCAQFASEAISVMALNAALPMVSSDTVFVDSMAILQATGSILNWYETDTSSAIIFTGSPFVTPSLTADATYWVSNTEVYDRPNEFVGMVNHQGSNFSDNSYIGGLIFDCFTPFTLAKTKVYTTREGERKITVVNSNGEVLDSVIVMIPSGTTVIDLNLQIPVGQDLLLTTDPQFNQMSIGSSGPQLRRSTTGIQFPYEINDVVSIKNSTYDQTRYYYFYDWEVDFKDYSCESERVPVMAVVMPASSVTSPSVQYDWQVYPNPTSGNLNVAVNGDYQEFSVSCRNSQGAIMFSNVLTGNKMDLNLGQFPKGIYLIELSGKSGIARKVILVQ
ncbi:MAG: FG-GAP-like repeat-containing protein [Saprospiraceae bacterium]